MAKSISRRRLESQLKSNTRGESYWDEILRFAHQDDRKKTRNDLKITHFGSVVGFRKTLFAGCSKRSQRRGARQIDERRRNSPVRCSEAIQRNEAYESFSAAR